MRKWLVVAAIASASPARADNQFWDAITAQVRQHEGAGLVGWTDVQLRRRGGSTLVIVRPALGYAFDSQLAAFLGYAWIPIDPDAGETSHEHRIWQQALWTPSRGPWKFQVRPRLEQRWLEQDDQVAFRLRVLGRVQWAPTSHPFQLVVWDELFVGFNDTERVERGFDQNRLFVGAGTDTRLSGLRVEVGYINVVFPNDKEMDHAVAVMFALTSVVDR